MSRFSQLIAAAIAAALLWCAPAYAAPSRVQGGCDSGHPMMVNFDGGTGNTTGIVTLGAAVGNGNTLVGGFGGNTSAAAMTIISVTDDKGNSYNTESVVGATTVAFMSAFSLSNITNGPSIITIVVTSTGSTPVSLGCVIDEFSGTATASTDERDVHGGQDQASPGTGTNGVTSGPFTTTVNGDLLYNATMNHNFFGNATLTPGTTTNASYSAGVTSAFSAFSNLQLNSAWAVQSADGSGTAATWTQSQNDVRDTFLISIKAASGAGATSRSTLLGVGP